MKTTTFYIYILECSNNSYYTGYTIDIKKRYADHIAGKGSKYTRSFKPKKIAVCWKIKGTSGHALKIEAFIKKMARRKKEELIKNPGSLRDFARGELCLEVKFYVCKV